MSIAGVRSTLGDSYQNAIAVHWLLKLLQDDTIEYVQTESTGLPDSSTPVLVDDVVVKYKDGNQYSHRFIQAKVNQPKRENWTLKQLGVELRKAKEQLAKNPQACVEFLSQSPFGEFHRLLDACSKHPHLDALKNTGEKEALELLIALSKEINCSEDEAFNFALRMQIGSAQPYEEWKKENDRECKGLFADATKAQGIIERQLADLNVKAHRTFGLTRQYLCGALEAEGCYLALSIDVSEAIASFRLASSSTAHWSRDIGGLHIPRSETTHLLELIEKGKSVLLLGAPGSGKTCVLMEVVDRLADSEAYALLFLRGDEYAECSDRESLHDRGVPRELEATCSRLAHHRRVVVVIDSLDVLSLARRHGPLKAILSVVDRLQRIDGVSILAACREFDHKYDPLLSSRSWDETVTCRPLDEGVLATLLGGWGIEVEDPKLFDLLRIPQNLKLYKQLLDTGKPFQGTTEAGLVTAWLEDFLRRCRDQRKVVEYFLRDFVERLVRDRRLSLPQEQLDIEEDALQCLLSAKVLQRNDRGQVGLAHQTLRDIIHAQTLLGRGTSLVQFCEENLQHPYIRSTLRTLFFLLNERDNHNMRSQVRAMVQNPETAFHLKRLICESLGELKPEEVGNTLALLLFRTDQELFRFFLFSLQEVDWFSFLRTNWEPLLSGHEDHERWRINFVSLSKRWVSIIPSQIIQFWISMLNAYRKLIDQFLWEIFRSFDKGFTTWDAPELQELFEEILQTTKDGDSRSYCLQPVSKWVKENNSGDEILWKFMTAHIDIHSTGRFELEKQLPIDLHDDSGASFLQQRMIQSETLLDLALNFLTEWSAAHSFDWQGKYRDNLLHYTNWERDHTCTDSSKEHSSLHVLCSTVSQALGHHSKFISLWWKENEPRLRSCPEMGIRYMLLSAYEINIPGNIDGIKAQVTDTHFMRYSRLDYEIGQLLNKAAPDLPPVVLETYEKSVLSLNADLGDEDDSWVMRRRLDLLSMIPAYLRSPDVEKLLETRRSNLGFQRPTPRIEVYGGWISSPISCPQLEILSNEGIIKLLRHYQGDRWEHGTSSDRLLGGRDEVASTLQQAAANDPQRFLSLRRALPEANVHELYSHSILQGCLWHLSYRHGGLTPAKDWSPVEPLPDADSLALELLSISKGTPVTKDTLHFLAQAVEGIRTHIPYK